jgi:hypothetical protein
MLDSECNSSASRPLLSDAEKDERNCWFLSTNEPSLVAGKASLSRLRGLSDPHFAPVVAIGFPTLPDHQTVQSAVVHAHRGAA